MIKSYIVSVSSHIITNNKSKKWYPCNCSHDQKNVFIFHKKTRIIYLLFLYGSLSLSMYICWLKMMMMMTTNFLFSYLKIGKGKYTSNIYTIIHISKEIKILNSYHLKMNSCSVYRPKKNNNNNIWKSSLLLNYALVLFLFISWKIIVLFFLLCFKRKWSVVVHVKYIYVFLSKDVFNRVELMI